MTVFFTRYKSGKQEQTKGPLFRCAFCKKGPWIPLGTLGPFLSLTISAMRVFYWLRHQNTHTTHFSECKYQRAITLEQEIGDQSDSGGINNLKTLHPGFIPVLAAVRGKYISV